MSSKHALFAVVLIYCSYTLTSHVDFDILPGVISKGASVEGDGNFGPPLIAANAWTHALNICNKKRHKR